MSQERNYSNLFEKYQSALAEIARLSGIISRLKGDGERLASVDMFQDVCPFCDNCDGYGYRKPEDVPDGEEYTGEYPEHSPDCPVFLHRELMKELDKCA